MKEAKRQSLQRKNEIFKALAAWTLHLGQNSE
jgi:hypothetical protein